MPVLQVSLIGEQVMVFTYRTIMQIYLAIAPAFSVNLWQLVTCHRLDQIIRPGQLLILSFTRLLAVLPNQINARVLQLQESDVLA